jgi:predicted GTPase
LLGKTQNGKSSLIINLSHRDHQEKLKESIKVGNGISPCTSELSFVPVVLRNTSECVILIDVPGLDDGRAEDQDEKIMIDLL